MYDFLNFVLTPEKIEEINLLEENTAPAKKNLIGQKFSRLTVIKRGPDYISPGGHKSSQWWCICNCPAHNIILARISNLTTGNTKSCGCWNIEQSTKRIQAVGKTMMADLTNQQFTDLLALEPTDERKNGSVIWKCQCSCGKIHYVSAHDLVNQRVLSCGHHTESQGVRKIKQILNDANIPYQMEKTYSDLRFPDTNGVPRFDFYINNEFLLEYDGEQHFIEKDDKYFHDNLKVRQSHDKYKNQWCKEHNIPLKRIPYTELKHITLDMIMGDKYLI